MELLSDKHGTERQMPHVLTHMWKLTCTVQGWGVFHIVEYLPSKL
jgi:hypothetical protein